MTATATESSDFLNYKLNTLFRGKTLVLCLSSSTNLTSTSTPEVIIPTEIYGTTGYTRQAHTFASGDGNVASNTGTMPQIQFTFTAGSVALSWSSAFILLGGKTTAGVTFASSGVNTSNGQITIANHGLLTGDQVMFAPATGGTLPGGTANNIRYYVVALDTNTITLYSDAALSQLVALSSQGAGNINCLFASGIVYGIINESAPVTLNPAQSYSYVITCGEQF